MSILPKKAPERSLRIIIGFLAAFFTVLGGIFFFATNRPLHIRVALQKFTNLQSVYHEKGIEKFLEAKEELKDDVSRVLSSGADSEAQNQAQNIATYLFPEILPNDDFEKSAALEDWAPLEKAIEKAPRTAQARANFDELRANIWNYESPDRTHPNVSTTAKEVIRIYEEISAP